MLLYIRRLGIFNFNYLELRSIKDFSILYRGNPLLSFFVSFSLFSIAGIPPLLGFYNKMFILLSLLLNNFFFFTFFILILSIISVFYYIRIIKIIFFDLNDNIGQFILMPKNVSYIIIFANFINFLFFFFPHVFTLEFFTIIFTLL